MSPWWSILEVLPWCPTYKPSGYNSISPTQRTHGIVITPFLRRNDAAASFRRNDDVIITSCVHWGAMATIRHVPFQMSKLCDETKSSAVFSYQQHRLSKAELEEELQYLEALWDELDFDMCVSHGDFHKNNMLYNPSTGTLWDIAITENWVVMMTTFPSLVAPEVVVMTTYGATNDDKVGIMTSVCFRWFGQ